MLTRVLYKNVTRQQFLQDADGFCYFAFWANSYFWVALLYL